MNLFDLDTYKEFLVASYRHKCDDSEVMRNKRRLLLLERYDDDYLQSILEGTESFIIKLLEMSENDYPGFFNIQLQNEPTIKMINLDLTGGWMSDTIVLDSENNHYSVNVLEQVFGRFFSIEPSRIEYDEEVDEDDDFCIVSEIPTFSTYIQCSKKSLESVREKFKKIDQKILEKKEKANG